MRSLESTTIRPVSLRPHISGLVAKLWRLEDPHGSRHFRAVVECAERAAAFVVQDVTSGVTSCSMKAHLLRRSPNLRGPGFLRGQNKRTCRGAPPGTAAVTLYRSGAGFPDAQGRRTARRRGRGAGICATGTAPWEPEHRDASSPQVEQAAIGNLAVRSGLDAKL